MAGGAGRRVWGLSSALSYKLTAWKSGEAVVVGWRGDRASIQLVMPPGMNRRELGSPPSPPTGETEETESHNPESRVPGDK